MAKEMETNELSAETVIAIESTSEHFKPILIDLKKNFDSRSQRNDFKMQITEAMALRGRMASFRMLYSILTSRAALVPRVSEGTQQNKHRKALSSGY